MKLKSVLFLLFFGVLSSCMFNSPYEDIHYDGNLINSSGEGIDQVTIYVKAIEFADTLHSDVDGYFHMVLPRGGNYMMVFQREGYANLTKSMAFKGGDQLTEQVMLQTIGEEAYLHGEKRIYEISHQAGTLLVFVNSNVSYTWSTSAEWLVPKLHNAGVELTYPGWNEEYSRIAYLYLTGEYDLKDTVQIIQLPDPELNIFESQTSGI